MKECEGCGHQPDVDVCDVYANPAKQHSRSGGCAMRTHGRVVIKEETQKLNPLKASKRKMKGVK